MSTLRNIIIAIRQSCDEVSQTDKLSQGITEDVELEKLMNLIIKQQSEIVTGSLKVQ